MRATVFPTLLLLAVWVGAVAAQPSASPSRGDAGAIWRMSCVPGAGVRSCRIATPARFSHGGRTYAASLVVLRLPDEDVVGVVLPYDAPLSFAPAGQVVIRIDDNPFHLVGSAFAARLCRFPAHRTARLVRELTRGRGGVLKFRAQSDDDGTATAVEARFSAMGFTAAFARLPPR